MYIILDRFLPTLTGSFLSRAGDPDRFIVEPDWFVDVSDRVIIFRTEPGVCDSIPRFPFFRVPNTPFLFAEEAQYNLEQNVQN